MKNPSAAMASAYTASLSSPSSNPSTSNWPMPGTSYHRTHSKIASSHSFKGILGGLRASRNSRRSRQIRLFRTSSPLIRATSSIVSTWRLSESVRDVGSSSNPRTLVPLTSATGTRISPSVAATRNSVHSALHLNRLNSPTRSKMSNSTTRLGPPNTSGHRSAATSIHSSFWGTKRASHRTVADVGPVAAARVTARRHRTSSRSQEPGARAASAAYASRPRHACNAPPSAASPGSSSYATSGWRGRRRGPGPAAGGRNGVPASDTARRMRAS